MKENSQNQLIRRRRLSMQILVCDDNPYMVNRLFDLIQHQISLQGISSTFSIVSNTDDLHNLDCVLPP